MKKLTALLILTFAVFSANISAQQKNADKGAFKLNNAQKMIPFVMGMSLAVLRERDEKDFSSALYEMKSIRYYSAEITPVLHLEGEKNEIFRRETVDDAVEALRKKMNETDRWKFLAGDSLGAIFVELKKASETGEKSDDEAIRFQINVIARLCEKPPTAIPTDVLKKLKDFGKLADEQTFSNKKTLDKLFAKAFDILETASREK